MELLKQTKQTVQAKADVALPFLGSFSVVCCVMTLSPSLFFHVYALCYIFKWVVNILVCYFLRCVR